MISNRIIDINIPSEPIGSIPRPQYLLDAIRDYYDGKLNKDGLTEVYYQSVRDTIHDFIGTGSKVITDGEQWKPNFITYPIFGSNQVDPDQTGFTIPFQDGHVRRLPVLSGKNLPFKYKLYASEYIKKAKAMCSTHAIKQPVISVSAMSLIYPANPLEKYSRDQFIEDMLNEVEKDIRGCLEAGADTVQIDATEARLSLKLDPSGELLKKFINLNNRLLNRFSVTDLLRIGIHSCPGGDRCYHSADVDYCRLLLPSLLKLRLSRFYLEFAAEKNKVAILQCIKENLKPGDIIFFGVINVIDPRVESPEEVRDLVLEIAKYIPINQIGTCDDCGFSPFGDDIKSRDIVFQKIKNRIAGTKMAEDILKQLLSKSDDEEDLDINNNNSSSIF
ncbi:hypothetical protein CYY_003792 [Polysphondylium violaceum]|uniref:Cobalamin-independent methionine synthase MetE C-terminal/archaeal domain-containing protein n=1 Tax=Polysphondylium violaceum TaxID=133409 RepID=A0A8J4PX78_9MYCE|nr:hypothetical protein CYY_003792 [Polysphondylium violaceum]